MNGLGVRILAPAFDEDIPSMLKGISSPTYLRLGYDERPEGKNVPPYAAWRQLLRGERGAIAALGPMAGVAWQALLKVPLEKRPSLWAVTEFNEKEIPEPFYAQVRGKCLIIVEEHVAAGGLGMHVALEMARRGLHASRFVHRHALGYPTDRFGSQGFHRAQCGLDSDGIFEMITGLANES